jgi:hypothetical protein
MPSSFAGTNFRGIKNATANFASAIKITLYYYVRTYVHNSWPGYYLKTCVKTAFEKSFNRFIYFFMPQVLLGASPSFIFMEPPAAKSL